METPAPNVADLVGMDVDAPGDPVLAGGQRAARQRAQKQPPRPNQPLGKPLVTIALVRQWGGTPPTRPQAAEETQQPPGEAQQNAEAGANEQPSPQRNQRQDDADLDDTDTDDGDGNEPSDVDLDEDEEGGAQQQQQPTGTGQEQRAHRKHRAKEDAFPNLPDDFVRSMKSIGKTGAPGQTRDATEEVVIEDTTVRWLFEHTEEEREEMITKENFKKYRPVEASAS